MTSCGPPAACYDWARTFSRHPRRGLCCPCRTAEPVVIDYETFAKIHDCHDCQGLTIMKTAPALGLHLSYSNRHTDLLSELVSRRYENKSTMITTNRPFAEWRHVFPNAACVVSLVDRLVHNAEILAIDGDSYRLKEAQERSEQRAHKRRRTKS